MNRNLNLIQVDKVGKERADGETMLDITSNNLKNDMCNCVYMQIHTVTKV